MRKDGLDPTSWRDVMDAIDDLLPYYERVNLVNTFGRLPFWRGRIAATAGAEDAVLEIGSGPGGLARLLRGRRVYCLDPSQTMIRFARTRVDGRHAFLAGLAEHIPLRDACVDRVYCSFSFRDFLDKGAALDEIARVLRPGGELHVLDATRPPPGLRRAFMDSWLGLGVPAVVKVLVPRRVRRRWRAPPFESFVRTYEGMASPAAYAKEMGERGFDEAHWEDLSMGSVFHLWGVRARTT